MPDPVTGLIVGGTALAGGAIQSKSAKKAGAQQAAAAQMGIEEERAAREEMRRLMQPFLKSGEAGLTNYMEFLGLNGLDAQQQQVSNLENAPLFQSLVRQGEQGILQNASATGGLRGGNTQGALAQFRPQMLNQQIQQQMDRLGGLATMGQNAAAGVGTAGMQSASSIANLLGQQGQARAGATLGSGAAWNNVLQLPAQFLGMQAAGGAMRGFGF